MSIACVVTTIQPPTECIHALARRLQEESADFYVMGDQKGPSTFDQPAARFYSWKRQQSLPFALARLLPAGHYTRKNLGYLQAIADGADCIYESDDDNMPGTHWIPRRMETHVRFLTPRRWANVYRVFSDGVIWPRGFPLNRINDPETFTQESDPPTVPIHAPIQQGLTDLSPDTDAIWYLLNTDEYRFRRDRSVALSAGTWCPFNGQTTWWWPEAYALLYLPSHCPFRLTAIWRSFVAQRCLWAMGRRLVFHPPETIQRRNQHRLMSDFRDEVPGYLRNEEIVDVLAELELVEDPAATRENLMRCYERLVDCGIVPVDELPLLHGWCEDLVSREWPRAA